ncbi:MAG: hypothetical protein KDD44_08935, partial [Bdellovibrionales bacterium]|nr:hypothetical protein [Bdellovibrionales bacterium]
MKQEIRQRVANRERGNLPVILALAISALLAIGGLAIETGLYFLKRQELQILAENVALGAALSLPHTHYTSDAAVTWFSILRRDGTREIAGSGDLTYSLQDNSADASTTVPYAVDSITVQLSNAFSPSVLPLGDFASG